MGSKHFSGPAAVVAAVVAIGVVGMLSSPQRVQAQETYEQTLIQQGFQIAPVPLNLFGRDPNLVGLVAIWSTLLATAMVATAVARLHSSFTPTPQAETPTLVRCRRSIRACT